MYLKHFDAMQEAASARLAAARRHSYLHSGLSRRQFLGAGLGGASLALLRPSLAFASPLRQGMAGGGMPNPIPYLLDMGELGAIHLHLPTETLVPGSLAIDTGDGDPSTINDFQGTVGVFEPFGGTGLRISPDGTEEEMWWAADARFIDGQYVDVDGNQQEGTFAFL